VREERKRERGSFQEGLMEDVEGRDGFKEGKREREGASVRAKEGERVVEGDRRKNRATGVRVEREEIQLNCDYFSA
jgi:hypothetical protein